jgi:hypothetical protein
MHEKMDDIGHRMLELGLLLGLRLAQLPAGRP